MIYENIQSLSIPQNRQRRTFDEAKVAELAEDILANGLINPITVRTINGAGHELVAGERRLRALALLYSKGKEIRCAGQPVVPGFVPCLTLGELDYLSAREAELSENVHRVDLTLQERVAAIAELHELRRQRNPSQTIKTTASEILGAEAQGAQITRVAEALIIAKHLADPDVQKAKTQDEAVRILRKKAEAVKQLELAEKVDLTVSPHTLLLGDSMVLAAELPANSFDVLLTDPPYCIGADSFGDQADAKHGYEDSPEKADIYIEFTTVAASRLCKSAAHAYVFCDLRYFDKLSLAFGLKGWRVWPRPLIWAKGSGLLPVPDFGPRYTYECLLYAYRGDKPVLIQGQPDVIVALPVKAPRRGAEKPPALFLELLRRSARPGDQVLDLFGGTGPLIPAANSIRATATYIERDPEAFALAKLRINEKVGLE